MTSTKVLLITNERDISADWVVRELRQRGVPFLRLNTERLPAASVTWRDGEWSICRHDGQTSNLAELTGIWYRRPERPRSNVIDALTNAERETIQGQWRSAVQAVCATSDGLLINAPWANDRAESKVWQLEVARSVGFQVPSTLISNDGGLLLESFDAWAGKIVVKALDAPLIEEAQPRFVFSQTPLRQDLCESDALEAAPVILQQLVHDKVDVRVTVIGDSVIAASTEVPAAQVDWRTSDPMPSFRAHTLDSLTETMCRDLVRELGLTFGAIDLALNEEGYWFLENNPNGEWGWLQKTLGLPIAETLVDYLVGNYAA